MLEDLKLEENGMKITHSVNGDSSYVFPIEVKIGTEDHGEFWVSIGNFLTLKAIKVTDKYINRYVIVDSRVDIENQRYIELGHSNLETREDVINFILKSLKYPPEKNYPWEQ